MMKSINKQCLSFPFLLAQPQFVSRHIAIHAACMEGVTADEEDHLTDALGTRGFRLSSSETPLLQL